MSSFKNVNSDYTITCNNGTGTLTVNANLKVQGNTTFVGNYHETDAYVTVASDNPGAIHEMGLLAQTGPSTYAGLRFNTSGNTWEISANVSSNGAPIDSYNPIGTVNSHPGGATSQIQFNNNGAFGASAALTFDSVNNTLTLAGKQVLQNIGNAIPTAVANATTIYSNPTSGGGTGLYVKTNDANDELISKSRAIIYSIIF